MLPKLSRSSCRLAFSPLACLMPNGACFVDSRPHQEGRVHDKWLGSSPSRQTDIGVGCARNRPLRQGLDTHPSDRGAGLLGVPLWIRGLFWVFFDALFLLCFLWLLAFWFVAFAFCLLAFWLFYFVEIHHQCCSQGHPCYEGSLLGTL